MMPERLRMMLLAWTLGASGLLLTACHVPETRSKDEAMIDVSITVVREQPGIPPLIRRFMDVTARNATAENQWLLIERHVPTIDGGVDLLQQVCAGDVCYGRFMGTGGFYGFWLAPGAAITVRNLEVSWWEVEGVDPRQFEQVRTATRVRLGDEDALSWFTGDPLIKGTAVVDHGSATSSVARRAPGDIEVPVSLAAERAVVARILHPP